MKNLFILISFLLLSCANEGEQEDIFNPTRSDNVMRTLVIDSCEYLYIWTGDARGGGTLSHKGNCKFCIFRQSQLKYSK